MNYKRLGFLGIALALLFWMISLSLRRFVFGQPLSIPASGTELLLLLGGALFFWRWIAQRLTRTDRALHMQAARLAALHRAGLAITTQQELAAVLQTVVDQSRLLIGARYGALGVLNETGDGIESFIVSGLSPQAEALLRPHPPQGHGILGLPIQQQCSIRVNDIAAHPAAVGFPPHHPPMHSFLGVPITSKGRIFGHLYLTDKIPAHNLRAFQAPSPDKFSATNPPPEPVDNDDAYPQHDPVQDRESTPQPFNQADQELLEMFATQAAIAIENAHLARQNREIAVLRERERFGMDLHDGIIQSIYAIGLILDDGLHYMTGEQMTGEHKKGEYPAAEEAGRSLHMARARVQEATHQLNTVITDIRHYIYDLRSHSAHTGPADSPIGELEKLAQSLRREAKLDVKLDLDATVVRRLTPRQNADLLQIVREATANIRRHAHATRVQIALTHHPGTHHTGEHTDKHTDRAAPGRPAAHFASQTEGAYLMIQDNGRGFEYPSPEPAAPESATGDGLPNIQQRTATLGGAFHLDSAPNAGVTIHLLIPYTRPPEARA